MTNDEIAALLTKARHYAGQAAFNPYALDEYREKARLFVAELDTALSSAGRLVASAPHPAPDATEHNLTQVEQRALHKALLASGKVLYRFSAPDATYGERLLEAAREMQASVSAPDATDWKTLCGAAVMERNAAQAENEKLRELASRTYDHLHELTAIIPYNPHNDVAYRITTDLMASLRAALSPPPLSPEKP